MGKAQRTITVNVTPEQLYSVISDFKKYPEFLSEVKGIEVTGKSPSPEVTYDVDMKIKRIKYTLRMAEQPPLRVTWSLVKGEFMKGNDGAWELKADGTGKTVATYSIDLRLGALVPNSIEKAMAESAL